MPTELIVRKNHSIKIFANHVLELKALNAFIPNEEYLEEIKELLNRRRPGWKYYALVEGEGFFMSTKEFRSFLCSEAHIELFHAIAFYSHNIPTRQLEIYTADFDCPLIPVRVFNKKEDARDWLLKMIS